MTRAFLFVIFTCALLAADVPRAEYPQPQFQRPQWLTLNGAWEFEFDDQNTGLHESWASSKRKFAKTITVPFAFETKKSGIGDTSFHQWVWYRRAVAVPADWKGKNVLLHFGAVDYRATVWVNGQMVAQHEGGSTPFHADITPQLKNGHASIVVRVDDPPTDQSVPRGKQYWEPKSRGIHYTRTTGIWQPVWLEATGDRHLVRVRATPTNSGTIRFDALLDEYAPGLTLNVRILDAEKVVSTVGGAFPQKRATFEAKVTNPKLWSLESPALYDVEYELRRGDTIVDRVKSYIGFREIGIANNRVTINGKPVYLKTMLDQGYWPESTLTPPSDEAIRFDIDAMRQMGFNGVRKHQKVEDPRFHYWADKVGFLISGEMANARRYDEDYVARFTREWMEAVERDYNHPSVIMWIPINESWGVPDLKSPIQQNHLRANYYLTKSLDPTRLVIENDGWEHVDAYDLFGIHDYAKTGDLLFAKYKDSMKAGEPFPKNGREAMAPGFKYNGAPVFLSEFGGIAYILPGSLVPADSWGYSGIEKTPEAALERLKGIYMAIAKLPFIGICYTQTTDVEQEINGLLSYDRKFKFDPKAIRALNDMLQ